MRAATVATIGQLLRLDAAQDMSLELSLCVRPTHVVEALEQVMNNDNATNHNNQTNTKY